MKQDCTTSTLARPLAGIAACLRGAMIFALVATASAAVMGRDSAALPTPVRDVGFEQRLDEQIPLDLPFRDETGRAVRLREYFNGKPLILSLVYFDCPMLCSLSLNGLTNSLGDLRLSAGSDFTVLSISFDPRDTPAQAAERKALYVRRYGRRGAAEGWHFLTGEQDAIQRLTGAVGFRYAYDPGLNQFAHPSGIVVLTPRGKIARYFFGIEYEPKDLRLGLVEASENKIGSVADQLLLLCYHYDPATGKYTGLILTLLRLGGGATLLGLVVFIAAMRRRRRAGGEIAASL